MSRTRNNGESQKDYASRVIRDRIISMDLVPGQVISENELSQALGISRTPVREALSDLISIQMIEVMPQRGCRVAMIDYTMIEEARFTRQVLETAILPKVSEYLTPASLLELRQIVAAQALLSEAGEAANDQFMEQDNAFHAKLFEIARMTNTYQMMSVMQIHFDRVRRIALHIRQNRDIVTEHTAILDAIEAGNIELARAGMEQHLSRAVLDRAAIAAAFPQYIRSDNNDRK